MMKKTCIILGTRPEIIKMSPVMRACERRGLDWFVLHTGQHYSYGMDRVFFEEMELPDARYNLDVGSGSGRHGEQTGKMMAGIEEVLKMVITSLICEKFAAQSIVSVFAGHVSTREQSLKSKSEGGNDKI